jgi:hypothetical protein
VARFPARVLTHRLLPQAHLHKVRRGRWVIACGGALARAGQIEKVQRFSSPGRHLDPAAGDNVPREHRDEAVMVYADAESGSAGSLAQ